MLLLLWVCQNGQCSFDRSLRNKWAKVFGIKIDQNVKLYEYGCYFFHSVFKNQICKMFINGINKWKLKTKWIAPFHIHRLHKKLSKNMHFTFLPFIQNSKENCSWHLLYKYPFNLHIFYRNKIACKLKKNIFSTFKKEKRLDGDQIKISFFPCFHMHDVNFKTEEKCVQIVTLHEIDNDLYIYMNASNCKQTEMKPTHTTRIETTQHNPFVAVNNSTQLEYDF